MNAKLLRGLSAILFLCCSLFFLLAAFEQRDAGYALADYAYTRTLARFHELSRQASMYRTISGWFLVFSAGSFLLAYFAARAGRDEKKCSQCAELVKKEAVKCRFCGAELISGVA